MGLDYDISCLDGTKSIVRPFGAIVKMYCRVQGVIA